MGKRDGVHEGLGDSRQSSSNVWFAECVDAASIARVTGPNARQGLTVDDTSGMSLP